MISKQTLQKQDSDRLYNLYVKPLEKEHKGKYATDKFGSKQTITFKVGDKVVGKINWLEKCQFDKEGTFMVNCLQTVTKDWSYGKLVRNRI